ncbi:hypothetical protein D3C85_1181050 [compost metagenome]
MHGGDGAREFRVGQARQQPGGTEPPIHQIAQQLDQQQLAQTVDGGLPTALIALGFGKQQL